MTDQTLLHTIRNRDGDATVGIYLAHGIDYVNDLEPIQRLVHEVTRYQGVIVPAIQVTRLLAQPNAFLLLARTNITSSIVGMATLFVLTRTTGVDALLEDVAVRVTYQGRGIGRALCKQAIAIAKEHGAAFIELTSSPDREMARKLYSSLGFVERKTGVFRLAIP